MFLVYHCLCAGYCRKSPISAATPGRHQALLPGSRHKLLHRPPAHHPAAGRLPEIRGGRPSCR